MQKALLSEESKLLARNWETFQDLLEAARHLRKELAGLLVSVKSDLARKKWWNNGWAFVSREAEQIYITRKQWRVAGEDVIWIGVERFAPEHLFGVELPPTLFVWIDSDYEELAELLADRLTHYSTEPRGEIALSSDRWGHYIVTESVHQCPGTQIDQFASDVRKQVVTFLVHYAQALDALDEPISEQLRVLGEHGV